MKNKLLIIGASGHGKVVADVALKMNKWQEISFLDNDKSIESSMGIRVIGTSDNVEEYIKQYDILVGIGDNTIRQKIHKEIEKLGATIPVIVHPDAVIGEKVKFGCGTVVMAGAIVNCCTKIGRACIINTGSTIDHDSFIEDFVHISPGVHIAGTVRVGKGSWLGIGSVVSNNIKLSKGCKIGAGAVVVNNILQPGVYVGIPAKKLVSKG
ncbi:acetyltransferase [Halobacillus sp. HZG1]|uniref:acetyltransferase n=1 Tax=Halobacillus sp. HZG1 TaxID=3111769 RepID=UPI002DBEAA34|nr:acetyltransferase [Halobacillus sp. HZG1]MEC3884065.1 acetyltransferase [Halobacillus sp. HZG1]